jgi:hypothetical protein
MVYYTSRTRWRPIVISGNGITRALTGLDRRKIFCGVVRWPVIVSPAPNNGKELSPFPSIHSSAGSNFNHDIWSPGLRTLQLQQRLLGILDIVKFYHVGATSIMRSCLKAQGSYSTVGIQHRHERALGQVMRKIGQNNDTFIMRRR